MLKRRCLRRDVRRSATRLAFPCPCFASSLSPHGHWLDDQQQTHPGIALTLIAENTIVRQPAEIEMYLLRIVQEAVNHALKHAQATHITVTVDATQLRIEDDGQGFDPSLIATTTRLGLQGMSERASKINATLAIVSTAGQGTRITLTMHRS